MATGGHHGHVAQLVVVDEPAQSAGPLVDARHFVQEDGETRCRPFGPGGRPVDGAAGAGAFNACLDKGEDQAAIRQDFSAGRARGVNATPYFYVNGRPVVGAGSYAQFASVLDAELRRVGQ